MAILSFAGPALAVAFVVHGAALPQSLTVPSDAPSCLGLAQGTTFTWPTNTEDASSIFQITCGTDYWGGDLRSLQADTFQDCLAACKAESQCVSVAYGGTSCYLKNTLTPGQSNSGVWSATKAKINKGLTCDATGSSDGTTYTSSKGDFKIVCGTDYAGNDLPATSTKTFEACIETCATTDKCVDVSYVGGSCYLKYAVGTATKATQVWTAVRVEAQPFVYGLTCENNKDDKKTYKSKNGGSYTVQCGVDYWGGDLSSVQTPTFETCMDACDTTTGCIDVSYSSGTCYMKNVLNTASTASWVWTGLKVLEVPLDLTQTQVNSVSQPADVHVTKDQNLFTQTLTGTNPDIGISTMLWFPTIPYTVYEISFEYYQEGTSGGTYFMEVGDNISFLGTVAWFRTQVGAGVLGGPDYGNRLGWTQTARQLNACWNAKLAPQQGVASGVWQSGKVILYTRTNQGYFRRDNYGVGTTQWRNVYVRQKTNDYCGITQ